MTPPQMSARRNPYVGPRSFRRDAEEAKLFFGREEEARQLLVRVQTERLTLFYAESGAGKSSLINTRLIPGMEERGYVVLPVGRVSGAPPAELMGEIGNIFAFNLMDQIDEDDSTPQRYAKATLSDFLKRLVSFDGIHFRFDPDLKPPPVRPEEAVPYVLIIDQFEEILTTHAGRWQDREDFFRQLDQAMRDDPNLWVVLSLREDFVARIEPYAPLLADRMRSRFYMQRMQEQQALDAVRLPAQQFGRPFAPEAAQALVDNLRQVRVAGEETAPGQYVEPVQLQVVCLQLWEGLDPSAGHNITLADLERLAGGRSLAEFVDQALMDFYTRSLAEVLADPAVKALPEVNEAGLRRFFSQQLITELGTRGFVLQGESQTGGLPNLVLRLLRDRYLLRAENRAGGLWYELVHDRFVEPIQRTNRDWFAQNQNPLTRAAQVWDAAGRSPDKLLTGAARTEAETQLAAHPATYGVLERTFVAASAEAARKAAARRQQRITLGAVALVVLFAVLAGWGFRNSGRATANANLATANANLAATREVEAYQSEATAIEAKADAQRSLSSQLAAQALSLKASDPSLGLLLAVESVKVLSQDIERPNPTAIQTLATILTDTLSTNLGIEMGGRVDRIVVSSANKLMIVSGSARLIAVPWPYMGVVLPISTTVLSDVPVSIWTMSQDQSRIAFVLTESISVSNTESISNTETNNQLTPPGSSKIARNKIVLWDLALSGARQSTTIEDLSGITTLELSPNGKQIFIGMDSGIVQVQDLPIAPNSTDQGNGLADALHEPQQLRGHTAAVTTMALASDGSMLVTGGLDTVVQVWDLAGSQANLKISGHSGAIKVVALSPDGQWIASGDIRGVIRLTKIISDKQDPEQARNLPRYPAEISNLVFSQNSRWLAATSSDGSVQIWNMTTETVAGTPITLHRNTTPIKEVSFYPSNRWLYAVESDGKTVFRWDLREVDIPGSGMTIRVDTLISALAYDGGNEDLFLGTEGGAVLHWFLDVKHLQELACQTANRNMTMIEWTEFFPGKPYTRTCDSAPAHPSVRQAYIDAAKERAEQGEITEARLKLRQAVESGVDLSDAYIEQVVSQSLLDSVSKLAREGFLDQAVAIVERASIQTDGIEVIGIDKLERLAHDSNLSREIISAARARKISQEEALARFQQAEVLDLDLRSNFEKTISLIYQRVGPRFGSEYLFGLHEPGGESLMLDAGKPGWILFREAIGHDPQNTNGGNYSQWSDQGLGIIAVLANGYTPEGTIPDSSQYENFAQRVANFVSATPGASIWVIGNEMNYWAERPGASISPSNLGEVITPELYAEVFSLCRQAIRSLPGHEDDEVLVGAVSPWNNQTTYPGNENGDWVQYFHDILTLLGPTGADGFTIHTYTHAADPKQIFDDVKLGPPFQDRHYNFRAYQDFMNAVPEDMRHLAAYITETDQDVAWDNQNTQWVQGAYGEINYWNNQPGNQKIRSLILYRWPNVPGDRWGIEGKKGVIEDFKEAMHNDYRWIENSLISSDSISESPVRIDPSTSFEPGAQVCNLFEVNLRTTPGYIGKSTDDVVDTIPELTEISLIQGPRSVDDLDWWEVSTITSAQSIQGWMAVSSAIGTRILMPDGFCSLTLSKPYEGDFPITQYFGENPDFYSQFMYDGVALRGNNGIDIGLPAGTNVLATDDGIVIRVDSDPTGLGNYVLIQHTWGESLYSQLNQMVINIGQAIQRGDIIATSGNTGAGNGPYLGFKIRINPYRRTDGWGGFSDPVPYAPWAQTQ